MKVYVDELPKEIWKDIENYEGIYQISSFGNIRKVISKNGKTTYLTLKQRKHSDYLGIDLSKNHIRKVFDIHRLVAKAFIPNPQEKPCVNHKDFNKHNNNVNNLEWVTLKENSQYSIKNNIGSMKAIIQLTKDGKIVKIWQSIAEAGRKYGSKTNIGHCCRGEQKTSYGFIWKFLDQVKGEV